MSAWDLLAVVMLVTGGVMYAAGTHRLQTRGVHLRRGERVAFWAGWYAALLVLVPPVDVRAARLFSVHMFQHEMLMLVAVPLMVVGRPIVFLLWSLPATVRQWLLESRGRTMATAAWRGLTLPVAAWALHGLAIWLWHLPPLYEGAVFHEGVHALQHATFVATAGLFWWGLVYGRYGRAGYGLSVIFVFSTLVHTGVLGAVYTLSTAPFYTVYVHRAAAADPLADQQLAGLIMWIPAGVVLTCAGLGLFVSWLAAAERRPPTASSPRASGNLPSSDRRDRPAPSWPPPWPSPDDLAGASGPRRRSP
jgi:cytochrome c oxidase assembly factor CtaG